MPSLEQLRDAYHDLEAGLDAAAREFAEREFAEREFAERGLEVTREHLGEVCPTAQNLQVDEDARFDFREFIDAPCVALRFAGNEKSPALEFRREGAEAFSETTQWARFDTLSKLLVIEGFGNVAGRC